MPERRVCHSGGFAVVEDLPTLKICYRGGFAMALPFDKEETSLFGEEEASLVDDGEASLVDEEEALPFYEGEASLSHEHEELQVLGGSRDKRKREPDGEALDLEWRNWMDNLGDWGPWGNEYVDISADLESLARDRAPIPSVSPSAKLVMPLLPFQLEWLGWSLNQEQSECKGGILADEMGMGKTIQAISLIVSSPGVPPESRIAGSADEQLPQVKATLVVCPVVALIQWRNEVQRFTDGSVKVLVYHGPKRGVDLAKLSEYDVVLTTFQIVESEFRKNKTAPKIACGKVEGLTEAPKGKTSKGSCTSNSLVHSVKWARIVLDEAHIIKDRQCNTAKAVYALESVYKWALSGTPVQNRVGELYSLVRYLQIYPYSYYFCKKCNCKSLDYKFGADSRKCEDCKHSPMNHFCWWNKFVLNPIKRCGYVRGGRKAMMLLKHKVLDMILLRRTKKERAADLVLPPRASFVRTDDFDDGEADFYQALYTQSQARFNAYVTAGTLVNNYAHIFDLITRLRQAVNHPYLVMFPATVSRLPGEGADAFAAAHAETGSGGSGILRRLDLTKFRSSTKIEALREEIMFMLEKDGAAKAIVFSQFTSMLDLIGYTFEKTGISFVKLDGSMSMATRGRMIDTFTNVPECKIFLISLKAGGVAINLTVASHVFLMDPWWNPAVEQQAQDRIHRLGQYKPIRVTRFVIGNTIEERILKLQEKKQLVFDGTVGGSTEALAKLTTGDLRFLFTS